MEVRPITQEMLLAFFADGNYHYSVNPSGLYAIHFSYTESIDCETHYTFLIEGKANDLVSVRGHSDHRYKTEKLAPLLISLNEYKNKYRWPKMTVSESNNRITSRGRKAPPVGRSCLPSDAIPAKDDRLGTCSMAIAFLSAQGRNPSSRFRNRRGSGQGPAMIGHRTPTGLRPRA